MRFGISVIWSVVLAICFEFSRIGKHYEYRSFLKDLLGKLWIGYEYLYLVGLVLVVSVMGSASGEIFSEMFQVKEIVGNRRNDHEINDSVSSASAYLRLTMVLNQMFVLRVVGINQHT